MKRFMGETRGKTQGKTRGYQYWVTKNAHPFPDSHLFFFASMASAASAASACPVPSPQEFDVSAVFGFVPETEPLVSIFFIRKEKWL